jgi:putative phosphoribosyl transferase
MSPRNQEVARSLRADGSLATLLFDLLTPAEAADRANVFDIELIAARLIRATEWAIEFPPTAGLAAGFFGASTGAAAALRADSLRPGMARAIVSRGGRPDLAGSSDVAVIAPTRLIVGSNDGTVLELNRSVFERLRCEKDLVVVPGAGHLFEEPGTLDEVARLAGEWFQRHVLAGCSH